MSDLSQLFFEAHNRATFWSRFFLLGRGLCAARFRRSVFVIGITGQEIGWVPVRSVIEAEDHFWSYDTWRRVGFNVAHVCTSYFLLITDQARPIYQLSEFPPGPSLDGTPRCRKVQTPIVLRFYRKSRMISPHFFYPLFPIFGPFSPSYIFNFQRFMTLSIIFYLEMCLFFIKNPLQTICSYFFFRARKQDLHPKNLQNANTGWFNLSKSCLCCALLFTPWHLGGCCVFVVILHTFVTPQEN